MENKKYLCSFGGASLLLKNQNCPYLNQEATSPRECCVIYLYVLLHVIRFDGSTLSKLSVLIHTAYICNQIVADFLHLTTWHLF